MRRILAVDDDLHTRLAIGIWLKQCGFRVAITDGGESGLAAPTVPLIAISGYAFSVPETDDPACFKMALSLGATRCLRKPFRPATLLGVIDERLSEAEQRRKHAAALAAIPSAPQNISRERANTG
jgi:CheY-like chemotaxis protein